MKHGHADAESGAGEYPGIYLQNRWYVTGGVRPNCRACPCAALS